MTFAEKVLQFNFELNFDESLLPDGIRIMNPFSGEKADVTRTITERFYKKYYDDQRNRFIILGINPGRFGAGITGVPFSDTKRLAEYCDIQVDEFSSHEPSSVFVYKVVEAFGGTADFYADYYINSLCPLGFVRQNGKGNWVNYNFYDDKQLYAVVKPFMIRSVEQQLSFGINRQKAFCLGRGKNFKFMQKLNEEQGWFDEIIPLDHPRYVVQYKSKKMNEYVENYIKALK